MRFSYVQASERILSMCASSLFTNSTVRAWLASSVEPEKLWEIGTTKHFLFLAIKVWQECGVHASRILRRCSGKSTPNASFLHWILSRSACECVLVVTQSRVERRKTWRASFVYCVSSCEDFNRVISSNCYYFRQLKSNETLLCIPFNWHKVLINHRACGKLCIVFAIGGWFHI